MLKVIIFGGLITLSQLAWSADKFSMGPIIKDFGPTINDVVQTHPLTGDERFKVVFDVFEAGTSDQPNRGFVSAARFLNMHAKAGIPADHIELAIVVHGKAGQDLLSDESYQQRELVDNPNKALLNALMQAGVQVAVCAQSAGFLGMKNEEFLPGVEVALSAMTKHALLQQQGFTLNPF